MVSYVEIKGFNEFDEYAKKIVNDGPEVFFFFSGSKTQNGISWCPDCVEEIIMGKKTAIHYIDSFEDFNGFIEKLSPKAHNVYFLFTGKKKENGRSWCIYCQIAEPVVKAYLGELQKNVIFAYVDVGDRDYWKDKACPFRTDSRTRLMVIPTLIKWNGVQRLEGSQCNKRDLLQMLFEEEE